VRELIVDSFAGGGGASTGIEMALGISPDIAINHDATAMAMHRINHPATMHIPHDIWKVDPSAVCQGRPVGLLWASPDCKHFSKAKGGKPVEKKIRDLAWVIVKWARQVAPRVIMMENVEEFKTWGPLGDDNRPCKLRKGEEFNRFIGELNKLGYKVEWRELRACDYGAPTIRKRLFLIARRDGLPIIWPVPTHGDPKADAVKSGKLLPWRTAAEVIDWSLPCYSIFLTKEEAKPFGIKRPLAPATMARIAKGVKRYVIDAKEPFIVSLTHQGGERGEAVTEPFMTVTGAHRGEKAIVSPVVTYAQQGGAVRSAEEPLHTVTASRKDANAIIAPTLIQTGYGERDGQDPRVPGLDKPLGTVVAGGVKHGLVAAHLNTNRNAQKPFNGADQPTHVVTAGGAHLNVVTAHLSAFFGDGAGGKDRSASAEEPIRTVTGDPRHAVIAAHVTKNNFGDKPASGAAEPLHTATSQYNRFGLVAAFLAQHNVSRGGVQNPGRDAREPASTILQSGSHQAVVSAGLMNMRGTADDQLMPRPVESPAATVSAQGGHQAAVSAFLTKAHGSGGQHQAADDPLHTIDCKDRYAAVTVEIKGETYVIADIGMRMLTPRELFRAQGFPDSYIINRGQHIEISAGHVGKLIERPISKTDQVSKCGNSVCPPMSRALVEANFAPLEVNDNGVPEFAREAAE
jgi:DNA (cytosine-5)-methyltransferase 1